MLARLLLDTRHRPTLQIDTLKRALSEHDHVVVAPHFASALDPILFGRHLPCDPCVVIPPAAARDSRISPFISLIRTKIIDTDDAASSDSLAKVITSEKCCVIFPEVGPTKDGIMQKTSAAVAKALRAADALIVPARASGSEFTPYSDVRDLLRAASPPRITIFTGRPSRLSDGHLSPRRELERIVRDAMAEAIWHKQPLFDSMLEMRERWGRDKIITTDPDGTSLSWSALITRIAFLTGVLRSARSDGDRLGLMLPNTSMTLASIIAAQRAGAAPAMINYSMGPRATLAGCDAAGVKTIVSSRRFVAEGRLDPLVSAIQEGGVSFAWLEDMASGATRSMKLKAAIEAARARPQPADTARREAEKTAVVLFTSGSEGAPKAVALSHMNIQANIAQVRTTLPFYRSDVMLAVMPMFHSYGLSTGVFMPLLTGMKIAFYPTPLHYKKIPKYARECGASVMLGTNAFLAGYAKSADVLDFTRLRTVVCGGDKMRESTWALWRDKFGITLLEGYGVTECAPVVGANRTGWYSLGSIGIPLPLIETSLTPVEGVEGAGRLVLKGPNIMAGYLSHGTITPPPETGYDTGDICSIDEDGFITIRGRAKRFAKIGGEMVSLAQIEEAAQEVWPDDPIVVVSVPDETKGETIVMLTERADPSRDELRSGLIAKGLPEIAVPKRVMHVDALPRIGVGKTDYTAAVELAKGSK